MPLQRFSSDTVPGPGFSLMAANNYNNYNPPITAVYNTFTVECWVNVPGTHEIDGESTSGYSGVSGQNFVLYPAYGGDVEEAAMGISVGTNGVSVYEHGGNYMPALLVWQGTVSGWTHVAVVYDNKTPKLYVNGVLVHTGLSSLKSFIYPGTVFPGGQYGNTAGAQMDEVRIWDVARTQAQIQAGMSTEVPGNSEHLVAYWPMNEGSGTVLHDVTGHGHDVSLFQGGYPTSYWVSGALSLEHLSVGAYRYAFNGQEKDTDIGDDDYDYGARIYDARLGRFLSVDPLTINYPSLSSYLYAINNPIVMIDQEGADAKVSITRNENGGGVIKVISKTYVKGPDISDQEKWRIENSAVAGAKKRYESKTVDVEGKKWTVEYDIQYVYDQSFSESKLAEGYNLMEINDSKAKGRSNVPYFPRNNRILLEKQDRSKPTVITHETGHTIGFVDRYTDIDVNTSGFKDYMITKYGKDFMTDGGIGAKVYDVLKDTKNYSISVNDEGYESNMMSSGEGLNDVQTLALVQKVLSLSTEQKTDKNITLTGRVDSASKGKPTSEAIQKAFQSLEKKALDKLPSSK